MKAQGHITVRRRPKDGAAGDSAIRLDLNNENDSLLYDAEGNLLSGSVVSVATLYKGEAAVSSGVVFSISERSGMSTTQATISGSTITVSGLSSSGYVMVAATYNNKTYYAKFSLKRIVGAVNYDLVVTPDAVAYNSTTGTKSASSINVKVFRTAQNGSNGVDRTLVTTLPSGYSLKIDGTAVTYSGSGGYSFNVDVSRSSHVISLYNSSTLVDEETVPINKSTNGVDGKDGNSIINRFMWSPTKPDTPTGTALLPSGWSENSDRESISPQYKSEDGSGTSSFIVNGVFRQNPAIGDSQTIAERVVFTTTKANQILYIDLHADSESVSYDYIAVSKLDNTAWTSNALAKIGGRNVSSVVKVLVPTAGTHFIIVGYRKDNSQSVGKDRGWYRFIPDENLNCWMSQGVVNGETGLVTSWSEPVKYVADSVDEESIYLLAESTATPTTPSSLPYVDDYVPPVFDDEFDSTKRYIVGSGFMYNGKAYKTIAAYYISLQYDSTTVYYADDEFIYNGKAYVCINNCPSSGILPTNTDYFDEILPTNSSQYFAEVPTWTDNPSNVSSAYRYQFVSERKKENGQWGAFTTPHLYNTAGISGLDYRIEYWQPGQTYRNDINDIDADPRIIHICINMPIALFTDPNFLAYQCVKTHSSSSIPLGAYGYWTRINNLGPLITPLVLTGKIIADYIDVDTLHVKHLDGADGTFNGVLSVYNGDNLVAKIGDTTPYSGTIYPFWIGGATPENAITKIDSTGILTTTKLVANGGSIGGFNIGTNYLGLSSSQGGAPSSNGMSLYQDFISFYEKSGTETVHTLVGTSVLSASTSLRGLVSLSAKNTDSNASLTGSLYGLMINVSGYRNPYAIYCEEGVFAGFRPQISIENTGKTLTNMDSVISCGNTSAVTFYLPTSPKHGQFYALIHSTETTMNITSSATHPIMRITKDGTTVVASTMSDSMEVVLLVYNAHATITYNSSTRTGVWSLTYMKV